jgi:hypothetical protein
VINIKTKFSSKKISRGEYNYRGFVVQCCGYYFPDHKVVWEAYDPETEEGVARGFSKKEVLVEIDSFMDKEK